jgi:eukaryotic-like serine/threonine-protein kinase
MEKDRTRRYASASELAADVTRHLKNEPVIARPLSVVYRVGKFVRKFSAALLAVSVTAIGPTVVSAAIQVRRAATMVVERAIEDSRIIQFSVDRAAAIAGGRDPDAWAEAVSRDAATRQAVEAAIFVDSVSGVAICDRDLRVVVGNSSGMRV